MTGRPGVDVIGLYLAGARVIAGAVAGPEVAAAWDAPSVLEEQTVASLVGHLARGGVWLVGEYLDAGEPSGPLYESAAAYYAGVMASLDQGGHQAIRDRGAQEAAVGRLQLIADVRTRLEALERRLPGLDPGHPVGVRDDRSMRLDDYLATRIVEQVVHLDDLARSVGRAPWPVPEEAEALVVAIGAEVGRRLAGSTPMIRALYRRGFAADVLPVF